MHDTISRDVEREWTDTQESLASEHTQELAWDPAWDHNHDDHDEPEVLVPDTLPDLELEPEED